MNLSKYLNSFICVNFPLQFDQSVLSTMPSGSIYLFPCYIYLYVIHLSIRLLIMNYVINKSCKTLPCGGQEHSNMKRIVYSIRQAGRGLQVKRKRYDC